MKSDSRLLACGLCAVLIFASSAALAQMSSTAGQSCSDIQMMQNKCGQQEKKKEKPQEKDESKQTDQYPNATRKEPKNTTVNDKEAKALNEGLAATNSGDAATAQKDLQPLADSDNNAFAKAMALRGLAQLRYNSGDTKGAIALQKQAVDLNSLPNKDYFPALFVLAQMYMADEDYSDALNALNQWMQQSGSQSADAYALKGNALYRLEKYPEAVEAIQRAKSMTDEPKPDWDQLLMASYFAEDKYDDAAKVAEAALAKDPNNAKLLMNVVQIYTNAHEYDKALPLLERARANGQITDETTYLNMAKLYFNIALEGKDTKTNALNSAHVIEEGMGKGIIKPNSDNYKLLGDAYHLAGDDTKANEAYDKGGLPHVGSTRKGHKKKS